jgi:hypothetical protein
MYNKNKFCRVPITGSGIYDHEINAVCSLSAFNFETCYDANFSMRAIYFENHV